MSRFQFEVYIMFKTVPLLDLDLLRNSSEPSYLLDNVILERVKCGMERQKQTFISLGCTFLSPWWSSSTSMSLTGPHQWNMSSAPQKLTNSLWGGEPVWLLCSFNSDMKEQLTSLSQLGTGAGSQQERSPVAKK